MTITGPVTSRTCMKADNGTIPPRQVTYSRLKSSVDARIHGVLEHGQYVMGPEVVELEKQLAEYVGAKHCIGVASGTDALLMALMALDIGPGDEVITVPFTFFATAEMIALIGAKPVFVDIDRATYNGRLVGTGDDAYAVFKLSLKGAVHKEKGWVTVPLLSTGAALRSMHERVYIYVYA